MDPWLRFRVATRARIGLGRAGDALPTAALLEFTLAHARARDAVHGTPDFDAIAAGLHPHETLRVHSQAPDRLTYLRRPDLGRRLRETDRDLLKASEWDAVFVVADGLSASAIDMHALPMIAAAQARLQGWRLAPTVLARQARVALGDEIGAALGASLTVLLIGERPGLTVQNSLGIYLTFAPCIGRTDAQRNCISNIHENGLGYDVAADKLAWLMHQALRLSLTGVGLKEDAPPALTGTVARPALAGCDPAGDTAQTGSDQPASRKRRTGG
jgi:ethanolamine ammonia-lyase small subunit